MFFVRYADPAPHLRLRLRGDPAVLSGRVLPALAALTAPLVEDLTLSDVAVATYDREVERYGGDEGIELAEGLFHHDSVAVLRCLRAVREEGDPAARWQAAILGVDELLEDFELFGAERLALLEQAQLSYGRGARHLRTTATRRALAARFRALRPAIARALDRSVRTGALGESSAAFARRSEAVRPIAAEFRRLAGRGECTRPLADLVGSFLHMFCNRILHAAHREQEFVLYNFLLQHHRSAIARAAGERSRAGGP